MGVFNFIRKLDNCFADYMDTWVAGPVYGGNADKFLEYQKKLALTMPIYTGKETCSRCNNPMEIKYYLTPLETISSLSYMGPWSTEYSEDIEYTLFNCIKLNCSKCGIDIMTRSLDADISNQALEDANRKRTQNWKVVRNRRRGQHRGG